MRVLVACEESQAVTIEFRKRGHQAFSCDTQPESGGHPEWHIQEDVSKLLKRKWDMMIAFPPCTYLCRPGSPYLNVDRYGDKATLRYWLREVSIEFFMKLANAPIDKIAIENPVGVMSRYWRKPDQIVNPYQFGDPYQKETCFWLKGLPKLVPTDVVEPEPMHVFPSSNSMPAWFMRASRRPHAERSKIRSKTFPGIAKAMAEQWG